MTASAVPTAGYRGHRTSAFRLTWLCILHSALCALWGCNLVGAVAGKLLPPPPVEAKYIPAKTPLVVVVENFRNPALNQVDSQRLAYRVAEQIEAHGVAPIVHPDKLLDLRDRAGERFDRLTIPQIGAEVGAQQVLYVNLRDLDVTADTTGQVARAHGAAVVRVVDAATGRTLWPTDVAEGYPVGIDGQFSVPSGSTSGHTLREPVYRSLSDQIAKLFYKWQPEG